jgi:nuclear pore complex protein Nup155
MPATNELYVPPPSTSAAFSNAKLVKNVPLPDALHQELHCELLTVCLELTTDKHTTANMGLFEEIERAWFTVDNKLFLWDYTDGRDFSRYDQQDSTIHAVGLVRARKDVFVDDIHYLLVICTATKATLLGLSRSPKGELSLYATNMSVEAPTTMTSIRGTDAGRIFLLGVNKDIYELEYSISSGWLSSGSKIWLTNRSSGYLSTWVPSVLQGANREGVESFVVDPQQGRLYALHTKGQLEWIDVSGNKFESRSRFNNLRDHFVRARLTGVLGNAGAQVVAIAPVPASESKKAAVVAIAASGARAYLGTMMTYYGGGGAFQIIATRPFYSSGTLLAVQPNTGAATASSIVTFTTPAVGRQSAMRENFDNYQAPALQEWFSKILIPASVWTIAEVASTNPARSSGALRRDDGIDLTELAREATIGARQFLVLTNSGLFRVEQPRPIDMLEDDLEIEKEQAVIVSRQAFGRVQLSAMAVLMGTSGHKRQVSDLVSAAVNILIAAEPPILQTSTTGTRSIIYSPRHDGLAATLARFLRPIWKAKVVATVPGPVRFKLGVSDKELLAVQGNLADLHRFLESHPFPRHQAEGDAKRAWDAEEASTEGLKLLLKQAIEAISFVLLLADYKLPDVIAKCDAATQGTLTSLSFEGLLTSQGGRDVARTLVTALIELQIGQELGVS